MNKFVVVFFAQHNWIDARLSTHLFRLYYNGQWIHTIYLSINYYPIKVRDLLKFYCSRKRLQYWDLKKQQQSRVNSKLTIKYGHNAAPCSTEKYEYQCESKWFNSAHKATTRTKRLKPNRANWMVRYIVL